MWHVDFSRMEQVLGIRLRKIQIRYLSEYRWLVVSMVACFIVFIVAAVISALGLHNYEWGRILILFLVRPALFTLCCSLTPLFISLVPRHCRVDDVLPIWRGALPLDREPGEGRGRVPRIASLG